MYCNKLRQWNKQTVVEHYCSAYRKNGIQDPERTQDLVPYEDAGPYEDPGASEDPRAYEDPEP